MRRSFVIASLAVSLVCLLALEPESPARGQTPDKPLIVGMMRSLFDEPDEQAVLAQMRPFSDLVRKQTNAAGEFTIVHSVDKLREGLKSGDLSLGVVLGLDYARLREGCPEAEPLVIALNELAVVKALVLVHKDCPAMSLADLKGKPFALPQRPLRFTRFFVEREVDGPLDKFFSLKTESNLDGAIEAVVEREAEATVVPTQALDVYRARKPGRFSRLKVLQESIDFPTGAIVYIPAKAKEQLVNDFRNAMLKAHETTEGRQTLTLWKLTHFEKPPKDFVQKVDELAKKYPHDVK